VLIQYVIKCLDKYHTPRTQLQTVIKDSGK
jgi:hypothetical protein